MRIVGLQKAVKSVTSDIFNNLIDFVQVGFSQISLSHNFSAEIKEVVIPAGVDLEIPHSLRLTPKYRIILRQRGNAVITDETLWTDKKIYLKNNGAVEVTLTVMIVKE